MNCTICGQPVVLTPSATVRAKKDNHQPAGYYTALFTTHADCALKQRQEETIVLIRRRRNSGRPDGLI